MHVERNWGQLVDQGYCSALKSPTGPGRTRSTCPAHRLHFATWSKADKSAAVRGSRAATADSSRSAWRHIPSREPGATCRVCPQPAALTSNPQAGSVALVDISISSPAPFLHTSRVISHPPPGSGYKRGTVAIDTLEIRLGKLQRIWRGPGSPACCCTAATATSQPPTTCTSAPGVLQLHPHLTRSPMPAEERTLAQTWRQ